MAPDCSTSRAVSPDPALLLTGPAPPSRLTSLILFGTTAMCSTCCQKNVASEGLTLASVTIPIVWPAPVKPAEYSGSRLYCLAKSSGVRLPVCTAAGGTPWPRDGSCTALLLATG